MPTTDTLAERLSFMNWTAEVSTAVNQIDQVTQQNAAMVEESKAASRSLIQKTDHLVHLINRFRTGTTRPRRRAGQSGLGP
jgi:methyl-accepting chemotaxis protein